MNRKKEYRFLLFDADETLFDFSTAEHEAFRKALADVGIAFCEENYAVYTRLNQSLWKALERGEITKPELLDMRFRRLFEEIGKNGDADRMKQCYQERLGQESCLLPGALSLCRTLAEKFELYLVTNGVAKTQRSRLAPSGLLPYLTDVFVSEEIGVPKPQRGFFDAVMQAIPGFDAAKALVIGDSLSSDILGGNNAGIDTCWYNPKGQVNDSPVVPTYTVASYEELLMLLL